MINWRQNAGGPSARIEEVIRALRRMGVNPVAGKFRNQIPSQLHITHMYKIRT